MTELDRYDYSFPKELIAQAPAHPRDSARLMVYRRRDQSVAEATFADLGRYLPPGAVLVFNRTKVIPARLSVTKETGGRADLLYVATESGLIKALSNRPLREGGRLTITGRLGFTVVGREGQHYWLKPSFPMGRLMAVLERHGRAPLPPYIKFSPLNETARRREYQAVFAREVGSVAAPTASLHFSRRLISQLRQAGIGISYVTLHVGLGTFASVTADNLRQGRLHSEEYRIAPATARRLNRAKLAGHPIIAVGTTVCRTLESAADRQGQLVRTSGTTNLFIKDGYRFRFIDGLITNFHVPKSSLLMLVAALVGRQRVLSLYDQAIKGKYHLFSFGDGMLIT